MHTQYGYAHVSWLQVPHLDLACLPRSLTELDAQQWHDLTTASVTAGGSSSGSTVAVGGSSAGSSSKRDRVWLPSLRRLVLPRTLQVSRASTIYACTGPCAAESTAEANTAYEAAPPQFHASDDINSSDVDEQLEELLQLHHHAALLSSLCAGCPELRELELVQWQLPVAAVIAAAKQWRHLRRLSFLQPESHTEIEALHQGLASVGNGALQVQLQERLVLSRYPWSSVLSMQ